MDTVIIVIQFFLSLSILVILHEFGHFLPARLFNTKVEKFYLFFDPWFSLFKVKKGDTEYGVGWLPLGGYVKISGMVDESFDKEQLKKPPQPWEFRSKPAWQRLIIMLGGVFVNFILGFFIFGMILWQYGEEYLPADNLTYGIVADSLGQELGLQTGDQILYVGDVRFEEFNPGLIIREIALNDAKTITVKRDYEVIDIQVEERFADELTRYSNKDNPLFNMRFPFNIANVLEDSPAYNAGLEKGDKVIGVNDQPTVFFDEISSVLKSSPASDITLTVIRNDMDTLQLNMTTTEEGTIGVNPQHPFEIFGTERREYTFAAAMPAGVDKGWTFLTDQIKAFGQMFRGRMKVSESLGGFGTIGSLFPSTWQWETFWRVTAILSLILGFMNLLPIPALDGGHVVFLLWEVITGRKVSDKVMETATMVGFIIIIALVLYANGLDVMRFVNK